MQVQTIDFKAIMARTDLLVGQHALNSAKGVKLLTPNDLRKLVTNRHPAVNVDKMHTVVKPF